MMELENKRASYFLEKELLMFPKPFEETGEVSNMEKDADYKTSSVHECSLSSTFHTLTREIWMYQHDQSEDYSLSQENEFVTDCNHSDLSSASAQLLNDQSMGTEEISEEVSVTPEYAPEIEFDGAITDILSPRFSSCSELDCDMLSPKFSSCSSSNEERNLNAVLHEEGKENCQRRVSCYTDGRIQEMSTCHFYIRGKSNVEQTMKIIVLDPGNNRVEVETTMDESKSVSRCTFSASQIGSYTAMIWDGPIYAQIDGSPLIILVIRNYSMCPTVKSRLIYFGKRDVWGIAYNAVYKMIYLADHLNHRVLVYDAMSGILENTFGSRGSNDGELCLPLGIAVDNGGERIFVLENGNNRVSVFDFQGKFLNRFGRRGKGDGELCSPWGVAVSPNGSLVAVADSGNRRIQLFDPQGNFIRSVNISERFVGHQLEFAEPHSIIFSNNGEEIFVADIKYASLYKLNIDLNNWTNITPKGISLGRPQGICVDAADNILLCDDGDGCIHVITSNGVRVAKLPGDFGNYFYYPRNVLLLPTGEILVLDTKTVHAL